MIFQSLLYFIIKILLCQHPKNKEKNKYRQLFVKGSHQKLHFVRVKLGYKKIKYFLFTNFTTKKNARRRFSKLIVIIEIVINIIVGIFHLLGYVMNQTRIAEIFVLFVFVHDSADILRIGI